MADLIPSLEQLHAEYANCKTVADSICLKLSAQGNTNDTDKTLIAVQNRIVSGITTLRFLDVSKHDHKRDSALVLRGMYDLHLQCLYLLTNPATLVDDFMAFKAVTQRSLVQMMLVNKGTLATSVRARPEFAKAVADRENDYQKVKSRFWDNNRNRCHENWYCGSLPKIAKAVGYEDEYRIMQKLLSNIVHSNPLVLDGTTMIPDVSYIHDGWMLTLRILGAMADHFKIPLDPDEQEKVTFARNPIL